MKTRWEGGSVQRSERKREEDMVDEEEGQDDDGEEVGILMHGNEDVLTFFSLSYISNLVFVLRGQNPVFAYISNLILLIYSNRQCGPLPSAKMLTGFCLNL